mmetsp:Transcript_27503/g.36055  ORF Transcript_27503/g.36055 Transcript_27503/m.36055 type:complete len:133 (+) Transcript_27503:58-456(+)
MEVEDSMSSDLNINMLEDLDSRLKYLEQCFDNEPSENENRDNSINELHSKIAKLHEETSATRTDSDECSKQVKSTHETIKQNKELLDMMYEAVAQNRKALQELNKAYHEANEDNQATETETDAETNKDCVLI